MMDPRDLNLNAHEQVEVLAEIIKASPISPEVLLQFIRSHNIYPDWGNMTLPRGRTVNQCRNWFNGVVNQVNQPTPTGPMSGHARSQSLQDPTLSSSLKRNSDQLNYAGGRPLIPKPAMSTLDNILNQSNEPPKKKRGRPSNAQKAAEREAAMARGEVIAPPKRELPTSSSSNVVTGPSSMANYAAQAAQAAMTTHTREQPPSAGESDSSSTKRRRGRPPISDKKAGQQQQGQPDPPPPPNMPPSQPGRSQYPNILSPQDDIVEHRPRP